MQENPRWAWIFFQVIIWHYFWNSKFTPSLLFYEEKILEEVHLSHISIPILLRFLLHWRDWLPVGGMLVHSQMVTKLVSIIQPIEHYVTLRREKCTSSRNRDHRGLPFMNKDRVCEKDVFTVQEANWSGSVQSCPSCWPIRGDFPDKYISILTIWFYSSHILTFFHGSVVPEEIDRHSRLPDRLLRSFR